MSVGHSVFISLPPDHAALFHTQGVEDIFLHDCIQAFALQFLYHPLQELIAIRRILPFCARFRKDGEDISPFSVGKASGVAEDVAACDLFEPVSFESFFIQRMA